MQKFLLILGTFSLLVSCDYFKQKDPRTPVARVNDTYLFEEDIAELISESTTQEDSILLVNNYINRWATQQLLMDRAKINLTDAELSNYNKLIEQYRKDLFTEAYKNSIIGQQLDSVISEQEMAAYYEENKENFKLNDKLLQVRYIQTAINFADFDKVKEQFIRFDKEARSALEETSIQFKAYNFNDSIWVKKETLLANLPVLATAGEQVLKKSNFTQLQDSLGVYLVKIENVLERNDIAPQSFVNPSIRQILLNKKKLELIKNLEKDITRDAIKDKQFETYPIQ